MGSTRFFVLLPVFAVFVLFPFFEGGQSSLGLFLVHSIVFAGLILSFLLLSRISIPKFIGSFLPFFLILIISFSISAYKFAGFLKLWDYVAAGIWAILLCTVIQTDREKFQSAAPWLFVASVCSTITAILIYNTSQVMRLSASFLNPNDYASYALLLFCFGIFCLEREANRIRKTMLITFLGILLLTVALSFSRGIFLAVVTLLATTFLVRKPGRVMKFLLVFLLFASGAIVALRYLTYNDPYQYYRLKIWKNSLRAVAEDPYLGVGLGILEYRSNNFNFPAETEVGRYSRIARSADNQYIQILAETGLLGFFTFLFGWIGLAVYLKNLSNRFFYLKVAWLILTVTALFSLPLQNTSVLFLFLFLVVSAFTLDSDKQVVQIGLGTFGRIVVPIASFLLYMFGVYLPFAADREFHLAVTSRQAVDKEKHLTNAIRYNPYQPYYKFAFVRRIIDAKPQLENKRWLSLDLLLDQSIALNPLESEFYEYKARIARILLERDRTLKYYSSAVSSYQSALDCSPFNVFLRLEFASFLFQLQRYDIAKAELEKILAMEPAFLNARLLLAALLFQTNHPEEAKTEYLRFGKDDQRFRNEAAYASADYVRLLLQVNPQQKRRVQELYTKAQS